MVKRIKDKSGVSIAVNGDDKGDRYGNQHRVISKAQAMVDGRQRTVNKVQTTIELLFKNGSITVDHLNAGLYFKRMFDISRLDNLRCPAIDRIPSSGKPSGVEPDHIIDAKNEVYEIFDWVGGYKSDMGRVLWGVIGEDLSLRQYQDNTGCNRKETVAFLKACLIVIDCHQKKYSNFC